MQKLKFHLPTLITITAPTCAGKSFLLEALVRNELVCRVVSTTDRAPRQGEIPRVHYDFISTEASKRLEENNQFAELVTYNGVRYGVTHKEMSRVMAQHLPPIVILEPSGLDMYRKYCQQHNWKIFSIYVETPENIRLQRLAGRTANDIFNALSIPLSEQERLKKITEFVQVNNNRLKCVLDKERMWSHSNIWDVQVDGTDLQKCLDYIHYAVQNRNKRSDIYR